MQPGGSLPSGKKHRGNRYEGDVAQEEHQRRFCNEAHGKSCLLPGCGRPRRHHPSKFTLLLGRLAPFERRRRLQRLLCRIDQDTALAAPLL